MDKSPLDNLVETGVLKKEAPDRKEFDGLVKSAKARLTDARNEDNSAESRFDLAYNASHALALAALRYRGYRPANQRYIVFQALQHTLGMKPEIWRVFDYSHTRRNQAEYQGYSNVEDKLLQGLIQCASTLEKEIERLDPSEI